MNISFKTFTPKLGYAQKKWYLVDAQGMRVGRLAMLVANILRGKHKPCFTANLDCGDNVIVVNAEKVDFTGDKFEDKLYIRHSGYPGGLKKTTPKELYTRGYPERVMIHAVKGMIGRGPMARKRLGNLYVYSGSSHKHTAQMPKLIDLSSLNPKNVNKTILNKRESFEG